MLVYVRDRACFDGFTDIGITSLSVIVDINKYPTCIFNKLLDARHILILLSRFVHLLTLFSNNKLANRT